MAVIGADNTIHVMGDVVKLSELASVWKYNIHMHTELSHEYSLLKSRTKHTM